MGSTTERQSQLLSLHVPYVLIYMTYIYALYILIYMPCLCMDINKCLVALVRINHPTS